MGDPVVDEEGDMGICEEMICLPGRRISGHYDGWVRIKGRRRQVGVGHEGDVGG